MVKKYLPHYVPEHGLIRKNTLIRFHKNLTGWMKVKHVFYEEKTKQYYIQPTTGTAPYTRFNKLPSEIFITDKNCPYKMGLTKDINFKYEPI